MKAANMYFFGEPNPSLHDVLWFYGSIHAMITIAIVTLLVVLF